MKKASAITVAAIFSHCAYGSPHALEKAEQQLDAREVTVTATEPCPETLAPPAATVLVTVTDNDQFRFAAAPTPEALLSGEPPIAIDQAAPLDQSLPFALPAAPAPEDVSAVGNPDVIAPPPVINLSGIDYGYPDSQTTDDFGLNNDIPPEIYSYPDAGEAPAPVLPAPDMFAPILPASEEPAPPADLNGPLGPGGELLAPPSFPPGVFEVSPMPELPPLPAPIDDQAPPTSDLPAGIVSAPPALIAAPPTPFLPEDVATPTAPVDFTAAPPDEFLSVPPVDGAFPSDVPLPIAPQVPDDSFITPPNVDFLPTPPIDGAFPSDLPFPETPQVPDDSFAPPPNVDILPAPPVDGEFPGDISPAAPQGPDSDFAPPNVNFRVGAPPLPTDVAVPTDFAIPPSTDVFPSASFSTRLLGAGPSDLPNSYGTGFDSSEILVSNEAASSMSMTSKLAIVFAMACGFVIPALLM